MIYIKPELKIDQWLPIEYFQYIPDGVTAIHCDTRDFYMTISTDVIEGAECIDGCVNVFDMIPKCAIDNKYLIIINIIDISILNIISLKSIIIPTAEMISIIV